MPLDGHSYLVAQGWEGSGTGLRRGAIAKPLAIPQKKTLAGLGKDRDEAFPFWDHLFTAAASAIKIKIHDSDDDDDSEASELSAKPAFKRTSTGILCNRRPLLGTPASSGATTPSADEAVRSVSLMSIAKREAAKKALYARLFRGPVLGPETKEAVEVVERAKEASTSKVTIDEVILPVEEEAEKDKEEITEKERKRTERRERKGKGKDRTSDVDHRDVQTSTHEPSLKDNTASGEKRKKKKGVRKADEPSNAVVESDKISERKRKKEALKADATNPSDLDEESERKRRKEKRRAEKLALAATEIEDENASVTTKKATKDKKRKRGEVEEIKDKDIVKLDGSEECQEKQKKKKKKKRDSEAIS